MPVASQNEEQQKPDEVTIGSPKSGTSEPTSPKPGQSAEPTSPKPSTTQVLVLNPLSAGIDFSRQNLTSVDVRF